MSDNDNIQSAAEFWSDGTEPTSPLETNGTTIEEIIEIANQLPEALDTSDATASAGWIGSGKTAYVNGEKVTGTLNAGSVHVRVENDSDIAFTIPILNVGGWGTLQAIDDQFGDAEADNVAIGKTFTSKNGLKVEGNLNTSKVQFYNYDGKYAQVDAELLVDETATANTDKNVVPSVNSTVLGDALPKHVLKGYTFSTKDCTGNDKIGIGVEGTLEVPDLSGVTATAKYVAQGYSFVDADGNTVEGLFNSKVEFDAIDGSVTVQGRIHQPNSTTTESFIRLTPSNCPLGNAMPADVLSGVTFSSFGDSRAGIGATGTMANNGAVALTMNPLDSSSTESVSIAKGYHDGSGTAKIAANLNVKLDDMLNGTQEGTKGSPYDGTSTTFEPPLSETIKESVDGLSTAIHTTQADLISQIIAALATKTGGGS